MNRKIKAGIATLLLFGLAGCAHDKIALPDIRLNRPAPVSPPVVQPMTLNDVHWEVYDLNGLKALVAKLEASGQNPTLYVLTQDGFQTLAMNLAEMKRYITDQRDANQFLVKAMEVNGEIKKVDNTPKPAKDTKARSEAKVKTKTKASDFDF